MHYYIFRRIAHGRGGLSSHRTRRHNNPASSSSTSGQSASGTGGPSALSTLSPSAVSARDAVDPIAELLSQLSGVRRVAGSSSSQLQQLQMELQLQRQQQAQRQTLDRLARRPPAASSASVSAAAPAVTSSIPAVGQSRLGAVALGGDPAVQGEAARGAGAAAGSSGGCGAPGYLLSSLSPDHSVSI